jgi:hypothetical protein
MAITADAQKVRKLEQQLLAERQQRIKLQTELGGVRSLARRLQLTLQAERMSRGEKPKRVTPAA